MKKRYILEIIILFVAIIVTQFSFDLMALFLKLPALMKQYPQYAAGAIAGPPILFLVVKFLRPFAIPYINLLIFCSLYIAATQQLTIQREKTLERTYVKSKQQFKIIESSNPISLLFQDELTPISSRRFCKHQIPFGRTKCFDKYSLKETVLR